MKTPFISVHYYSFCSFASKIDLRNQDNRCVSIHVTLYQVAIERVRKPGFALHHGD